MTDTTRPLFISHSGFDGSAEELHGEGARAGVERGYHAPRAAAFEKRLSAVVANDGVYDFGLANLGGPMSDAQRTAVAAAIRATDAPDVDARLAAAMAGSPTANWALTHGMFVTGQATPRAYVAATLDYHLRDGVAEQITCPTLVLDAEEDMFFKGQAEELFAHL